MNAYLYSRVTVSHHTITLETNCLQAQQYLAGLDTFSGLQPYRFVAVGDSPGGTTLTYRNASDYSCAYDDERDALDLSFPWDGSGQNVIRAVLWHIFELKRQRAGEYLFHASAVVRNGMAVVLTGPSESGKTTVALDLCINHGFAFYANDLVLMGLNYRLPPINIW